MAFTMRLLLVARARDRDATVAKPPSVRAMTREHKRLARLGLAGDCDCRYCS